MPNGWLKAIRMVAPDTIAFIGEEDEDYVLHIRFAPGQRMDVVQTVKK